jgi:hypothetical protein
MDVVEDSELAIDAYSTGNVREKDGERCLRLYGLLQALFLQQDAVINLCESLKIQKKIEDYPKLKEIREIRNDSAGHDCVPDLVESSLFTAARSIIF